MLWILETFCILPTMGIKAIASLIPIHSNLWKLSGRNQLQTFTLSHNHTLKALLEKRFSFQSPQHYFFLEHMTSKQQLAIKSSIVDTNNCLNRVFLLFDSLNKEFHSEKRLIDTFSNCFCFHKANWSSDKSKTHHCNLLDDIVLNASSVSLTVVIVLDASIKNNTAMSITHIYSFNSPLKKTLYHAINVILMEVELFTIRCGINQTIQIPSTSHIIVITDTLHIVQKIFNLSIYLYQIQSIAIFKDLQKIFNKHSDNSIEF